LKNIRNLLKPHGWAVVTTPNVENVPARFKFLLKGKLRMMDEQGDPTHITPIFFDLLTRQYLPRTGLVLTQRLHYPESSYLVTQPRYQWIARSAALLLKGECLRGDNHIFILQIKNNAKAESKFDS
jgi:hypothetical protein